MFESKTNKLTQEQNIHKTLKRTALKCSVMGDRGQKPALYLH